MAKYRKKPLVVEAVRLAGENEDASQDVIDWLAHDSRSLRWESDRDGGIAIHTLEGVMRADPGDYVIQGVIGELYPCKPAIFESTYDAVLPEEPDDETAEKTDDSPSPMSEIESLMEYLANKKEEGRETPIGLIGFRVYHKSSTEYMTNEGWVLGTKCWVVSLDTYNRLRVNVCREKLIDALTTAKDRLERYLDGDPEWLKDINKERIDKHFGSLV